MTTQESAADLPTEGVSKARAYEIAFCEHVPEVPEPGEIYVLAADPKDPAARQRSLHVLEHGLADLPQGAGPIRRIVVPLDPTLDDMLAATFCSRLLAGESLPAGAQLLAEYAENARAGFCDLPASPLDASISGIFLADRNASGEDLSKPHIASKFLVNWRRMSDRLMQAAEEDADPCKKQLFDGTSFDNERCYLAKDYQEFLRDVAMGEIWNIQLPGQAARSRALVLRHPMSLQFKCFARSEKYAPGRRPFDLLAVQNGPSEWVFSTDPACLSISLLGLHEKLQAAEVASDPARAASNPWFDGTNFQHTLIASPHGSSLLSDNEIERIARRWCNARRKLRFSRNQKAAIFAALAILLCVGVWRFWPPLPPPPPPRVFHWVGPPPELKLVSRGATDRALLIVLQSKKGPLLTSRTLISGAKAIGKVLREQCDFQTMDAFNLTGDDIQRALDEAAKVQYQPDDQLLVYLGGYINKPAATDQATIKDDGFEQIGGGTVDLSPIVDRLSKLRNCRHVLWLQDGYDPNAEDKGPPDGDDKGPPAGDAIASNDHEERLAYIRRLLKPAMHRSIAVVGKASKFGDNFYPPLAAALLETLKAGGGKQRVVTLDKLKAQLPDGVGTALTTSDQPGGTFLFVDARPAPAATSPNAAATGR